MNQISSSSFSPERFLGRIKIKITSNHGTIVGQDIDKKVLVRVVSLQHEPHIIFSLPLVLYSFLPVPFLPSSPPFYIYNIKQLLSSSFFFLLSFSSYSSSFSSSCSTSFWSSYLSSPPSHLSYYEVDERFQQGNYGQLWLHGDQMEESGV